MFDDDVILLLIIDINNIDYVFEKWFILWCINNNKKIEFNLFGVCNSNKEILINLIGVCNVCIIFLIIQQI